MKYRLENEYISVEIIPELGGKICSLYDKNKGFDAAAKPKVDIYKPACDDADFGDYDMSGLDDAFPNVDEESIVYQGRQIKFPNHGEIWSRSMEILEQSDTSMTLAYKSNRFGYYYKKQLSLEDNGLHISYEITNIGEYELPCIWTFHGLLRYEKNMQFQYPRGMFRFVNVLADTPLGEQGREYIIGKEYVLSMDKKEVIYDFINSTDIDFPYYMKYYCPDIITDGECRVVYEDKDIGLSIEYDSSKLPWFGMWINAGGLNDDYNFAFEMTDGYYDKVSRAIANNRINVLPCGQKRSFEVKLSFFNV